MSVCQFRLLSHHFDLRLTKVFFVFYDGNGLPYSSGDGSDKKGSSVAVWLTVFTKETSATDSRGHRSLYLIFKVTGDPVCPCSQEEVSHTGFLQAWRKTARFAWTVPSAVISIPISVLPCLAHNKKKIIETSVYMTEYLNVLELYIYIYMNIDKPTH